MLNSLVYSPIGGVNLTDGEDVLGDQEVRDSSNFLYERGAARTRPGLNISAVTPSLGSIDFAKSLSLGVTPMTYVIVGNKLYKLVGSTATEITGSGITFGSSEFHNGTSVNGEILIANSTGGLVRWDPTGGTYTILSNAKYRYVTGHFSRALGAYDTTATNGDKKVGWCVTGDIGDWTSIGSGSNTLSDCPDDITGLGNINNVVVIPRRTGIHLAFPTGYGSNPFRFEAWGRDGSGFPYPSTLCFHSNVLYGVGKDDVYTFDLANLTPIGYKIRDELLQAIHAGVTFRGFVSTLVGCSARTRYHLVPNSHNWPHYCYDVDERKWSKHSYEASITGGFHFIPSYTTEGFAVFGSNFIGRWDDSLPCETDSWLKSRTFALGDVDKDHRVVRLLLRYRDQGEGLANCRFAVTLNQERREEIQRVVVGSPSASNRWTRAWFNFRLEGQDGEFRVDIPAGQPFSTNLTAIQVVPGGEYRGS